jgi:hypothetical protein
MSTVREAPVRLMPSATENSILSLAANDNEVAA